MTNFRQQLFHEYASKGIAASIETFKTKYQPKKESRFNVDGITYEIGPARLNDTGIEFEISSKMPQDELASRTEFESYFAAIKDVLKDDAKQPVEIDMDSIVQEIGGEETKERDYVRLRYCYALDEMYTQEAVGAEIARLKQHPAARPIPEIPNINTLAGRVVLLCVEDFMHREATTRMERLIAANQEVRHALSAKTH